MGLSGCSSIGAALLNTVAPTATAAYRACLGSHTRGRPSPA